MGYHLLNTENYDVIENNTLYEHLSSTQETHIGNTQKECVIFHRGDKDDIEKDEGDSYENFKIIDGTTSRAQKYKNICKKMPFLLKKMR